MKLFVHAGIKLIYVGNCCLCAKIDTLHLCENMIFKRNQLILQSFVKKNIADIDKTRYVLIDLTAVTIYSPTIAVHKIL